MLRSHARPPRTKSGIRLIRSGPACSSCTTKLRICMTFTIMLKDEPISFLYGNSESPSNRLLERMRGAFWRSGQRYVANTIQDLVSIMVRGPLTAVQTASSLLKDSRWRPSLTPLMPHHRVRFATRLGVHSSHLFRLTMLALSTTIVLPAGWCVRGWREALAWKIARCGKYNARTIGPLGWPARAMC
jgi:hypothetical protein